MMMTAKLHYSSRSGAFILSGSKSRAEASTQRLARDEVAGALVAWWPLRRAHAGVGAATPCPWRPQPRQERFILAAPPSCHFFVLPPCRATWCVLAAFPARSYQAVWSEGGSGRHQGRTGQTR